MGASELKQGGGFVKLRALQEECPVNGHEWLDGRKAALNDWLKAGLTITVQGSTRKMDQAGPRV